MQEDECTVRLTLLPSVGAAADADATPLDSPVQLEVVAGACGPAPAPAALSGLAFSGETALFELPPPAAAALHRRLRRRARRRDDDLGPRAGLRAEVVAADDLGDDWSRLVRDAAAAAPACAAAGRSLVGLRVDAIAAPPDKRHAPLTEQLAHLRGPARVRVIALFGAGEGGARFAEGAALAVGAAGIGRRSRPSTRRRMPRSSWGAARVVPRALRGARAENAGGGGKAVAAEGAARREEMEGLWREAALAVAACALTLGRIDLAQLACRRVIAEEAGCSRRRRVRLAQRCTQERARRRARGAAAGGGAAAAGIGSTARALHAFEIARSRGKRLKDEERSSGDRRPGFDGGVA